MRRNCASSSARKTRKRLDQKVDEATPMDTPVDAPVYKFKRNYVNNEVLQIMEDFIGGRNGLPS